MYFSLFLCFYISFNIYVYFYFCTSTHIYIISNIRIFLKLAYFYLLLVLLFQFIRYTLLRHKNIASRSLASQRKFIFCYLCVYDVQVLLPVLKSTFVAGQRVKTGRNRGYSEKRDTDTCKVILKTERFIWKWLLQRSVRPIHPFPFRLLYMLMEERRTNTKTKTRIYHPK